MPAIIKFRAFNKRTNEMKKVLTLKFTNECEIYEIVVEAEDRFDSKTWFPEYSILMQSLGLKDKHGIEIFEGDILQSLNPEGKLLGVEEIDQKWVKSCGCCATIYGWGFDVDTSDEIIGNIHQNPELLKANN